MHQDILNSYQPVVCDPSSTLKQGSHTAADNTNNGSAAQGSKGAVAGVQVSAMDTGWSEGGVPQLCSTSRACGGGRRCVCGYSLDRLPVLCCVLDQCAGVGGLSLRHKCFLCALNALDRGKAAVAAGSMSSSSTDSLNSHNSGCNTAHWCSCCFGNPSEPLNAAGEAPCSTPVSSQAVTRSPPQGSSAAHTAANTLPPPSPFPASITPCRCN